MNNTKKTQRRHIGDIGEEIAAKFLIKHGFKIIGRNYLRKWGEIDIIAQKGRILHFIEVKTCQIVSRETENNVSSGTKGSVTREIFDDFRPEENVHPQKLKRLGRAIKTYLADYKISRETQWQLDVVTVRLDRENKKAKIEVIENIIL